MLASMARKFHSRNVAVAFAMLLFSFAQTLPLQSSLKLLPGVSWSLRGTVPQRSKPTIPVAAEHSHAILSASVTLRAQSESSHIVCDVVGTHSDLMAFTPQVKTAMNIVKDSWASSVPVRARVTISTLDGPDTLAQSSVPHLVEARGVNGYVPVGSAKALIGDDLSGHFADNDKYDVVITLNSLTPWHDHVDGSVPADKYDMVTVIVHEIYHGLMLAGSLTVDSDRELSLSKLETSGKVARFDTFLADQYACGVLASADEVGRSSGVATNKRGLSRYSAVPEIIRSTDLFFSYEDTAMSLSPLVSRVSLPGTPSFDSVADSFKFSERFLSSSIPRGRSARSVGIKLRGMQAVFLDRKLNGAKKCFPGMRKPALLRQGGAGSASVSPPPEPETVAPATAAPPSPSPASSGGGGGGGGGGSSNTTQKKKRDEGRRIAGLPVWAFVLVILFSILALAILLGLCFLLFTSLKKKKPLSPKSYYYTYTGRTKTKSVPPPASGSRGDTLSSERESVDIVDVVRATEAGGPVMTPTIKSASVKKPKTTTKRVVCKASSSSTSMTRRPLTSITKTRIRPRHHHHHHHHHRHHHHPRRHHHHHHRHHCHYVCHCCHCKGRRTVAEPSTTSSYHRTVMKHPRSRYTTTCGHRTCRSATTCRYSTSKSTTVPPAPPTTTKMRSSRKCCPCKKCTTTNTIRIHVS